MALQMLKGLDFLHRVCHIIHTDLKPENVLLDLPTKVPPLHTQPKGLYTDTSTTANTSASSKDSTGKKKKSSDTIPTTTSACKYTTHFNAYFTIKCVTAQFFV
jgi:serine/threonine protein kinase